MTKVEKKDNAGEQRIRVKIKSFDHKIIDRSTKTIVDTVKRTGAKVNGPIPLPTGKKKYTVNASTFVNKTSKDQYEMRTHKRLVDIINPSANTVEALSSLNLPAGVSVEIKM